MKLLRSLTVRILIGLLLLVGLLILIKPPWQRAMYGNWNKTYATLTAGTAIRAFVHGNTDSPVAGWTAELVWNKETDRWFVYYLNHEAYFEKYELRWRDANIEVVGNGELLGTLDTRTGAFFHAKQNYLYTEPLAVIHGTNLADRQKWTYWTNPDGTFAHR